MGKNIKTCVLVLTVDYWVDETDPDRVADSVQQILDTATSTDGILDSAGITSLGYVSVGDHIYKAAVQTLEKES